MASWIFIVLLKFYRKYCYVIVKPHHEEDIFVITRGGAEAEV